MQTTEEDAATMTMVGTMLYCAPEVVMGERYNERVDVYSYSVMLLEIVLSDSKYVWKKRQGHSKQVPLYQRYTLRTALLPLTV